jgi:hypothetical protein
MEETLMKLKFCVALLTASAYAGLITTEGPPSFELHRADKSLVTPWPKTEAECVARAAASIGEWQCVIRRNFTTVGTCADVPMPEWPVQLTPEGFLIRPALKVEELPDGSWGPTQEEGYVPAPFPECWVLGWVPYTGAWHAPEPEGVHEPVCQPTLGECPP